MNLSRSVGEGKLKKKLKKNGTLTEPRIKYCSVNKQRRWEAHCLERWEASPCVVLRGGEESPCVDYVGTL